MNDKSTDISKYNNLVLAGTFISIITFIGALKELENINILQKIQNYYSTSLSSILILLLVLDYTIDEILEIYKTIKWIELININNYDICELIDNYCIYNGDIIEITIKYYIKYKGYNENITLQELYNITGKSLNIVVANISKFEEELINYKSHPSMEVFKAIEMGLTIPFIVKSVRYNNNIYICGTLNNNFPICYCNMDETIGLITKNIYYKNYQNIIEFINLIFYAIIRTNYKTHKNILELENKYDLEFNINMDEIYKGYSYGLKMMKEFIQNSNSNDN